jgi:cyanophycinase
MKKTPIIAVCIQTILALGFSCAKAADTPSDPNGGPETRKSLSGEQGAKPPGAHTRTVLVGGGIYPRAAMARFIEWAGGVDAKILVITWGGEKVGEQKRFNALSNALKLEGAENIEMSPLATDLDDEKGRKKVEAQIAVAKGIFFTGGHQDVLMKWIGKSNLGDILKRKHAEGIVFGGNSAGAAVMADAMMIVPEEHQGDEFKWVNPDWIEFQPGLGMIKTGIVDQHFLQRRRQSRMFAALIKSKIDWAMGVDEGNAVAIEDETTATVFGTSSVWIVAKTPNNPSQFTVTLATAEQGALKFR